MGEFLFFVEVLIGGLLSGIMYSLVALGFVLIFKASGVFNFAQGALVLFAALTFVLLFELGDEFWHFSAWVTGLLAAAALALYLLHRRGGMALRSRPYRWSAAAIAAFVVLLGFVLPDAGQNLWRAIFVALLVFLVLTVGQRRPSVAAAVLAGMALASLFLDGAHFWRALGVTLVVMVVLALAIERVVLRPLVNQAPIILFMATIGLNFVIEGLAQGVWDAQVHALDLGIDDVPFEVAGVFISQLDLFAAAVAALMVTVLAVFFNRTRTGRALRAVADDHQAAMSVGIPLQDIWGIVWATAGIVALFAGLMWGARLGVQFSLALLAFKALPVLILGGFTSVPGAVVGGLIIGATEKLFEVFIGIPFLGGGTENWSPYMLALVFLLFRPQGIFGEKIIERV